MNFLLFQIPLYKGASEAINPNDTNKDNFFGGNGFGDIDIWKPNYPNVEQIIQAKSAVNIIHELVIQVRKMYGNHIFNASVKLISKSILLFVVSAQN